MLQDGDTLVPLIFMSDATHLSNYSGDKKEWPIYMTIGNLSSELRQKPTAHSVVMVALLPIPPKHRHESKSRRDEQNATNRSVLQEVLYRVLEPLTFPDQVSDDHGYYNVLCADRHYRRCKPVLAAWLADCPEYNDLHGLERGVCMFCECPKAELGDPVTPKKEHPTRDHNAYRQLNDNDTAESAHRLADLNVHQGFNAFRHIPCTVAKLPKPDLLHTMQLGMLDHLHKWLFHFMKTHGRLNRYNALWLSVPAYHDLTPKTKSYEEVSQWSGKEVKEMSRYLLAVVVQTLRGGTGGFNERAMFNGAIECTRALLEFYMYSRYKSHDDDTIGYMEDALLRFHRSKEVFLGARVGKRARAKAGNLRTELVRKRKAEEELRADSLTPSQRRREHSEWRDFIDSEVDLSKENDAHFNFIKIHLLSHFTEQIRLYGSLPQWSAETHEHAHRANMKDGWNASNHNLDYLPQIFAFHRRVLCFEIRSLNLRSVERLRKDSDSDNNPWQIETTIPDPSSARQNPHSAEGLRTDSGNHRANTATITGPSSASPLFTQPMLISPQNDSKTPDGQMKHFGALVDSTDVVQRSALLNGTRDFLLRRLSKRDEILDEELRKAEICIYHAVKVVIDDMDGERKTQMCRCTGEKPWRGAQKRNDWVWVRQRPGPVYGALHGRLPCQLLRLFKMRFRNDSGCWVDHWMAFARTTVVENSGNIDPISKLAQVRVPPTSRAQYQVFSAGNIVGCAHLIPEKPFTDPSMNERWVVNSHIDLMTWNEVYN